MPITVEFFGIPRQRTGISNVTMTGDSLNEVLFNLHQQFPKLGVWNEATQSFPSEYLISLNGKQFISQLDTVLESGDHLLIMTADVGG